jgi:hypothetical protein
MSPENLADISSLTAPTQLTEDDDLPLLETQRFRRPTTLPITRQFHLSPPIIKGTKHAIRSGTQESAAADSQSQDSSSLRLQEEERLIKEQLRLAGFRPGVLLDHDIPVADVFAVARIDDDLAVAHAGRGPLRLLSQGFTT